MTASGPPAPPPFPPSGSPPPVPQGWKAEWSGEHKAWYYFNQATQTSTWENPLTKAPLPSAPAPPPYGSGYAGGPSQSNRDLYVDDDEKSSTTDRGLGGHLLGRVFGSHSPHINEHTRPTSPAYPTGNQLYIHAACFCDQDITQKVRAMITPQQTFSVRCDSLTYHFGDPWPNHHKQFSLLYSYGQGPWQLIASMEGQGTINLHPVHPVDNVRAAFVQAPTSRIVALVWGTRNALLDIPETSTSGRSAGLKVMEIDREGRLEATNAWMGFDGMPNRAKMACLYYRNADGSVSVATAREGETLRLPWNAFAGAI